MHSAGNADAGKVFTLNRKDGLILMEDYFDEVFAETSEEYAQYFSRNCYNIQSSSDKNQKEMIADFDEA